MRHELTIVYEDDWIVVVEKPSGMLCVATDKGKETTAHSMLRDEYGKIFIVHRLDRDTSGVLVFAKDEDTKRALQDNWEDIVLERRYIAVLEGKIADQEGYIETWMYENPRSLMVHCYEMRPGDNPQKPPRKDWKYASSHCRKTREFSIDGNEYTEVEFSLETGRRNQIRVHSQWIGHPIAGDKKYRAQTNPFGRLALHARVLAFIHPWTGQEMRFNSKLPRSLKLPKNTILL